jgi:hypothetical protein
MPNYCENFVEFIGSPARIRDLKELITSDENIFDFNRVVPMPKDQITNDWNIENWGTKWNAVDVVITEDQPDIYALMFYTAWSEPLPIYQKLAELFPDIRMNGTYFEGGNWSGGEFESNNGTIWTREWSEQELLEYLLELDPEYYEQKIDDLDIEDEESQISIIEYLPTFFYEAEHLYASALVKLLAVYIAENGNKDELEGVLRNIRKQFEFLHEADVKRYWDEYAKEVEKLAKNGVINND